MRTLEEDLELISLLEIESLEECINDFYAFCVYMDPVFFTESKWHLKLKAKYLEKLAYKEINRLIISEPPRAGKSYTVSLFHAWLIGKYPSDSSMRNSYAAELAEKFSYNIREIIQKDKYIKLFPEIKLKQDKRAVNDWAITKATDSTYFCAGVGGPILGKGCKRVATLDDPIKNIEEAMSENILEKVWNWYTSTHLSRFEKGCGELHVATRWSRKDPIGRILEGKNTIKIEPFVEKCGDWHVITIPALINGETFCDEIHSTKEYLETKLITDDFIWEAEYMQNPIESKGLLFPVEQLKRFSISDLGTKKADGIIGYTDTADKGEDSLSSPIGKRFGKYTYITDIVFSLEGVEITEPLVAQQIIDTKCDIMKIESNNGGSSFARNVRDLVRPKWGCSVIDEQQTSNKETRILMNSGYVKEYFYFRDDYEPGSDYDKFMRAFTSYVKFGKNRHDDAPDSITGLAEMIKYRTFEKDPEQKAAQHWALSDPVTKQDGYTSSDEVNDKYLGGW